MAEKERVNLSKIWYVFAARVGLRGLTGVKSMSELISLANSQEGVCLGWF